ncbi:hypothetical protein [Brucella pseudogrignonensis]|uniref:hypothetical protein n=1 Tax=Brucella pseudogrignonensis TaxID=419475 RepID=UPI003D97F584
MTGGLLEAYLIGLGVNASCALSAKAAKAAYKWIQDNRSDLIERIASAQSNGDSNAADEALNEATGAILAAAGLGSLEIDGGSMNALKEIRFDHQHGFVRINNATIQSKTILTGGGMNSSGTTTISGNTTLKSKGTSIDIGEGASIVISGGASITQT